MLNKVVFLGMGGTIAGTATDAADNVGYRAAQVGVNSLLDAIPALSHVLGGRVCVSEQVAQVDSKDMDFPLWIGLTQRLAHFLTMDEVTGVVITHGTDTLEETAFFLTQVIPAELLNRKPVVLTCAMRPASSMSPDGPQNILDASALVCAPGAKGVMVVCAGTIHSARDVQKIHPYRVNALDSGDLGPLGYVEEGVVRGVRCWPCEPVVDTRGVSLAMWEEPWPRVEIVMNYVGATGATVRALCAAASDGSARVRGIVVAGTGNGTLHKDLERALWEVYAQGVRVVRASRCAYGSVVPGKDLGDAFPHSNGLSPVKARIAMMLELMA